MRKLITLNKKRLLFFAGFAVIAGLLLSAILFPQVAITTAVELKEKTNSLFIPSPTTETHTPTPKTPGIKRQASFTGRLLQAETLAHQGRYTEAHEILLQQIKQRPDLVKPLLLLGEIYLQTGNTEQLRNLIEQLRRQFPDDPAATILEVRRLINAEDFSTASQLMKSLRDQTDIVPPDILFYQAVFASLQNDHDTAKELLSLLERLPVARRDIRLTADGPVEDNAEASTSLSPEFADKIKALIVIYEEFAELDDGTNPHLFTLIAKQLAENNEFILARTFADTAIKEEYTYVDAWLIRGYSEYMLQDYENALKDLQYAYELDPIRPETHYFMALTLTETGDLQQAALFYEKSLEHEFEFTLDVKWKLVEIFTQQRKHDRALELYQQIASETKDTEIFVPVIHKIINVIKQPSSALDITEALLDEHPEDPVALNLHAWAMIANEQFIQAENLLDRALDLDAENPRTYLNFGLLYETKGEFSRAAEYYQESYNYGQNRGSFNSVTNLAAEKYNALVEKIEPSQLEASGREASSP